MSNIKINICLQFSIVMFNNKNIVLKSLAGACPSLTGNLEIKLQLKVNIQNMNDHRHNVHQTTYLL